MNKILDYLRTIENKLKFSIRPTRDFYKTIGIGQKRWKMLIDKKAAPTTTELEKLSAHFGVPISEFYDFQTVNQ